MAGEKARDGFGQDAERQRRERRDAQLHARTAPQVARAFAQRVDAVLDLADLGEQGVRVVGRDEAPGRAFERSEEHTSELQSLMRTSYAVFCLKKNRNSQYY